MTLDTLDAAVSAHLAHGAMAGADPLTDSLYGQLEAPAAEGATPAVDYCQGLADAQRELPWLRRGMALAVVAALAASACSPWGFAR